MHRHGPQTLAASTVTSSAGNQSFHSANYPHPHSHQPQPAGPWAPPSSTGAPTSHGAPPARWLAPPAPLFAGRPLTTYNVSQTSGSGSSAVANMLATQRPTPTLAEIMSAETQREQLERALQAMAASQPPDLFLGRFLIMQERKVGGQATVQFARSGDGGFFQYAIKCALAAAATPAGARGSRLTLASVAAGGVSVNAVLLVSLLPRPRVRWRLHKQLPRPSSSTACPGIVCHD